MTILEGREKCEIKLTKPLKFLTGRKDCIREVYDVDNEGKFPYSTYKKEVRICNYIISSSISKFVASC